MSVSREEAVDLAEPPPAGLVTALDHSRDENGGPVTATETEKKEEKAVQGEDDKEYFFGCGPWHPDGLQIFRDARFFTFLICLFATIEGALVSGTYKQAQIVFYTLSIARGIIVWDIYS